MQFDEEAEEFGEDFLSDKDPSILHFLLASGDEGCSFTLPPLSCTLSQSTSSASQVPNLGADHEQAAAGRPHDHAHCRA